VFGNPTLEHDKSNSDDQLNFLLVELQQKWDDFDVPHHHRYSSIKHAFRVE